MVEVDIHFLAGVAVTVFLALLFFAVIVLWDISLAPGASGTKSTNSRIPSTTICQIWGTRSTTSRTSVVVVGAPSFT
ncbi:hypothetical protein ACLI4Q_05365 [Natrialbaceae archaeon A-CW1-1]